MTLYSFTCASISYGIMFDSSTLVGNRYIIFFLFAAIRYLASVLTIIVDSCIKYAHRKILTEVIFNLTEAFVCCRRCGRKVIFCTSLGTICVTCTAIGILTYFGKWTV